MREGKGGRGEKEGVIRRGGICKEACRIIEICFFLLFFRICMTIGCYWL